MTRKMLRDWLKKEDSLVESTKGCRRIGNQRTAKYPAMEAILIEEFRALRARGIKVRPSWFRSRAKSLMLQTNPDQGNCGG